MTASAAQISTRSLFFGLGGATNVEVLRVEWPLGIIEEKYHVSANQFLTLTEPSLLRPLPGSGNGLLQMQFVGRAGSAYALEASSNLVNWTTSLQFTNSTRTNVLSDDATGVGQRFYRAVLMP
jgi:hypothetical protein